MQLGTAKLKVVNKIASSAAQFAKCIYHEAKCTLQIVWHLILFCSLL